MSTIFHTFRTIKKSSYGWCKCIQHFIQHWKFSMLDEMLDAFAPAIRWLLYSPKCMKNSWQYWKPLPDSFMTFLAQHIIFWYCNLRKYQKPLITKTACKMKNIWLICKKVRSSTNVYSFSAIVMKFICIFENGYIYIDFLINVSMHQLQR